MFIIALLILLLTFHIFYVIINSVNRTVIFRGKEGFPNRNPLGVFMRIANLIPSISSLSVLKQTQRAGSIFYHKNGRAHAALSIRISGESQFRFQGNTVVSKNGSITFVSANLPYEQSVITDSEIIVLHFVSNIPTVDQLISQSLSRIGNQAEITELFQKMLVLYNSGSLVCIAQLYADFYSLLAILLAENSCESVTESLVERANQVMKKHFSDSLFSIADLASRLSVSESSVRRAFLKEYGASPRKKLTELRIKHACAMLSEGSYSISEIAERCGFSSHSYFTRVFKNQCGKTPTEFFLSTTL